MQEAIQAAVLGQPGLADRDAWDSIPAQQFSAAVMRPGSLSRPALMQALVAFRVPADAVEVASQSLLELQAFLTEVRGN